MQKLSEMLANTDLIGLEMPFIDFTQKLSVQLNIYDKNQKLEIEVNNPNRLMSLLNVYLGEGKTLLGWNLKSLFSWWCFNTTPKFFNSFCTENVFDLFLIEKYLDIHQNPP